MKTDADTPRYPVPVRFSTGEKQLLRQAAAVNGQDFSKFVRDAALSAAGDCLEGVTPVRRTSGGGSLAVLTPSGVLR